MSALVAFAPLAIVSNKPVRCPTLIARQSIPSFRISMRRDRNSGAPLVSSTIAVAIASPHTRCRRPVVLGRLSIGRRLDAAGLRLGEDDRVGKEPAGADL